MFVLCVLCLTVLLNCLLNSFAMCVGGSYFPPLARVKVYSIIAQSVARWTLTSSGWRFDRHCG